MISPEFIEACSAVFEGRLEKRASSSAPFYQLIKYAAISHLTSAGKAGLEFAKKSAPAFVGTGAALGVGAYGVNRHVNKKIDEAKDKAKQFATGTLAALGTAAAAYGAYKGVRRYGDSQMEHGTKQGLVHGSNLGYQIGRNAGLSEAHDMSKYAEEDHDSLATCFFLDEVLCKSAEAGLTQVSPLVQLNNEMLEHVAQSILEKMANPNMPEAGTTAPAAGDMPPSATPSGPTATGLDPNTQPAQADPTAGDPNQVPAQMAAGPGMGMASTPLEEPSPEEQAPPVPVGMEETEMYNQERLLTGAASADTQMAINQEQKRLADISKAIQNEALHMGAVNPQLVAAADLHQNKINTLQNYMNALMEQRLQTTEAATAPMVDPMGAPMDPMGVPGQEGPMPVMPMEEQPMEGPPAEEQPMEEAPKEEEPKKDGPKEEGAKDSEESEKKSDERKPAKTVKTTTEENHYSPESKKEEKTTKEE